MFLKLQKKNEKIFWTKHAKEKMRQYQLSEKRVLRILRKPDRREEGIAPGTIAQMQITGTKKNPTEVWTMYQIKKSKIIKIISAWRYPGRTPAGQRPIIPEDILQDLLKEGIIK
jgi:hypothetical protein